MIKKIIPLLMIFILVASFSSATAPSFKITSPKITDKYVDYDLAKVYSGEKGDNVTITLVVWGMINVVPEKGYIKEYDVNITDSLGNYVHCFLATENGSKAMSYIIVNEQPHLINYTISTSTLTWYIPSGYFQNITENVTVNAYAGIADLSKDRFIFLDHAQYPAPPPKAEGYSLEFYLLTGITIFAVIVAIVLAVRRFRK